MDIGKLAVLTLQRLLLKVHCPLEKNVDRFTCHVLLAKYLATLCQDKELELLISGLPDIDIEDTSQAVCSSRSHK